MRKTRTTDYKEGQLLEIIETTFHDYPLGTVVKVLNSDWHSYHVYNVEGKLRYWWVKEEQVKPARHIQYQGFNCVVNKRQFAAGGFQLQLIDAASGESVDILNKWLPGLTDEEVALDTNNCGKEVIYTLLDAEVIEGVELRSIQSGFCSYPVYKLKG